MRLFGQRSSCRVASRLSADRCAARWQRSTKSSSEGIAVSSSVIPTSSGAILKDSAAVQARRQESAESQNSSRSTDDAQFRSGTATPQPKDGRPAFNIKVKRKAPWGAMQLRDSWTADAMSKRDNEKMGERLHREYRYHPHEFQRRAVRQLIPAMIISAAIAGSAAYYVIQGKMIWEADPQTVLNIMRQYDTSPRSKLYPFRTESELVLPEHIRSYREKKAARLAQEAAEEARREEEKERALQAAIHRVGRSSLTASTA